MKKKLINYYLFSFLAVLYLLSCSKTTPFEEAIPQEIDIDSLMKKEFENSAITLPTLRTDCPEGPKYKDTLIYNESKNGKDFIVKPINNPGLGKYYSWPQGMSLDSLTGSINVSQSETGLMYRIGFVRTGSRDTCIQTLRLAGASYIDSIYNLSKNQTLAIPYFDANPQIKSICTVSPDDDDDDDHDGNGYCEFSSSNTKVKVKSISGTIDLKQTLAYGAFGSNPVNGKAIKVSVYYKLNDKSNKTLQQMDVQIVYYETRSKIPQSVIDYVSQKRSDIMSQNLITPMGNPRPPLIIITRS